MGTEVCSSVGSFITQLENAKVSLQKIDERIKKVVQTTGRYQNDRNPDRGQQNSPSNYPIRGGSRIGRQNFYQDQQNNRSFEDDRQNRKRPQETKTVFSRLSTRPGAESDGEDEKSNKKPRISSQVIRDMPTKQQVLKAQTGDEVSKARNRRMFGSLLGTLQKFRQEEMVLKNKEDKKAQVEKKIEEQANQERENQKKERQNLFAEREIKKATIKALEAKMYRTQEYEKWESSQKPLLNFIQTKAKPHIFWYPKKITDSAQDKLVISRKKLEKTIEKKQEDLKTELESIEQRILRNVKLPPGTRTLMTSLSSDQLENTENDQLDNSADSDDDDDDDEDDESYVEAAAVNSTVRVKQEVDDADRVKIKANLPIKQEGKENIKLLLKVENGEKSNADRKAPREDDNSSSDDEEMETDNGANPKIQPMADSCQPPPDLDATQDDPGGKEKENEQPSEEIPPEIIDKPDEDTPTKEADDK